MIEYNSEKNIFDVPEHSVILFAQNVLGYGVTGVMNKLMKEHPQMFQKYREYCSYFKDKKIQEQCLGSLMVIPFPNEKTKFCNLMIQRFITDTKLEIDIGHFKTCMSKVITQTKRMYKYSGIMYELHIMNNIGTGIKPEVIQEMHDILDAYFADSDIKLVYHI